jgi:hypothetical protein
VRHEMLLLVPLARVSSVFLSINDQYTITARSSGLRASRNQNKGEFNGQSPLRCCTHAGNIAGLG